MAGLQLETGARRRKDKISASSCNFSVDRPKSKASPEGVHRAFLVAQVGGFVTSV
jgi:hypothetical protein